MLQLKKGVILTGVRSEILFIIYQIQKYFEEHLPKKDFVITSLTDGKHMKGSLHYKGLALDMRSRDFYMKEAGDFFYWFVSNYDKEYDLVVEKDHFHIEYDPK